MDDIKAPRPANTGPVMDIQAPPVSQQATDVQNNSVTPVTEAPQYAAGDAPMAATEEPQAATPLVATPGNHGAHHRAPIGAIMVAVVVAAVLAVVSVYAFNNTQRTADNNATDKTAEQAKPAVETVKQSDVDATTKDIDATMGQLDESSQLNSEELSDNSLGL